MAETAALVLDRGRVVDPRTGRDAPGAVGIRDGRIVDPAELPGAPRVDLRGAVIAPGFIDLHVHLRDPGQTSKETLSTGTAAAARGGFTTILAMPNTTPPVDSPAVLSQLLTRLGKEACVRVLQAAAITLGRSGDRLADLEALARAGAAAFTDDGSGLRNNALMLAALRSAAEAGIPLVDHCEDLSLSLGRPMNEGPVARRLGLDGQPSSAEEVMVARDIVLARQADCPVHIQHVSSAFSVQLIRTARQNGVPVSAEVTPHHLCLTEEACETCGTLAKMNPPLRRNVDRDALVEGVRDGTLSCIATDHAPHTRAEKKRPFAEAPFGVIGLETAVPVCMTALYHSGLMNLASFVACFTTGPARVLRRDSTLRPGMPADLTIIDPEHVHTIDVSRFASRAGNTPFAGWTCKGAVLGTVVDGRWIYRHSRLDVSPPAP